MFLPPKLLWDKQDYRRRALQCSKCQGMLRTLLEALPAIPHKNALNLFTAHPCPGYSLSAALQQTSVIQCLCFTHFGKHVSQPARAHPTVNWQCYGLRSLQCINSVGHQLPYCFPIQLNPWLCRFHRLRAFAVLQHWCKHQSRVADSSKFVPTVQLLLCNAYVCFAFRNSKLHINQQYTVYSNT